MTNFADLASVARLAIDAVHGEAAVLKPTERAKGPHGRRTPSTTDPEATISVAYFQDTELAARRRAQPMIGQTGERMVNRSPEIFGSTGYAGAIAVGWKLLREASGDLHEIISIDPDGVGNRILGLAAIKGA